jgi:hypothetical protein
MTLHAVCLDFQVLGEPLEYSRPSYLAALPPHEGAQLLCHHRRDVRRFLPFDLDPRSLPFFAGLSETDN